MNIVEIPVGSVVAPEVEMREVMTREGMEELAASIKRHGIRQNLTVVKRGANYEIVAGYRRWMAAKLVGLATLPCSVIPDDPRAIEEVKIHENLQREDVNVVDEAHYYKKLVDERGFSLDDIVKMVGKGAPYVENRFEIAGWDEKVKAALSAKHISITVSRELMKFRDVEARHRFLTVAVQNGVTQRTMEAWRLQFEAESKRMGTTTEERVEKSLGAPLRAPSVFCKGCSCDLRGMVVYYVPLCVGCNDALEDAKGKALRGGGGGVVSPSAAPGLGG